MRQNKWALWLNRFRSDLFVLLTIIGGWILVDIFFNLHDYFLLADEGIPDADRILSSGYWIAEISTTIFVASIVGFLILFAFRKFQNRFPMGLAILLGAIVIIFTALIGRAFAGIIYGAILGDQTLWETLSSLDDRIMDQSTIRVLMDWGAIVILTLVGVKINEKYGPGLFWEFLRGKYFRPKKEERIFLFLDMTDSTTIAEKLGHRKHYNLLNDFFYDISSAIRDTKGRIYQYVGDEIIITWPSTNENKAQALNCLQRAQNYIQTHAQIYQKKYGLVPEFKAGIHSGEVTVGEIGSLKRDLVYTGDTLNTAARIRGKCNELDATFLSSRYFIEGLDNPDYHIERIGELALRGKHLPVELYRVFSEKEN